MSINFNEPAPEREDEDDHDLLTYGEVKVRLYHEVQAQRARIAELEASEQDASQEKKRLARLLDAAERNSRSTINDDNFEKFFGYRGTARRNT